MGLKIAAIQFPVFKPYAKPAVEIYFSGCSKDCKSCHNPEIRDFNYGEDLNSVKLTIYLGKREDLFEIISITGGEFLDQNGAVALSFIQGLSNNFPNKELWLFTGKEKQDVPQWCFRYFDKIKIGRYDEAQKQEGFPASKNQMLLIKGIDY